jgi:hypothetical protein
VPTQPSATRAELLEEQHSNYADDANAERAQDLSTIKHLQDWMQSYDQEVQGKDGEPCN